MVTVIKKNEGVNIMNKIAKFVIPALLLGAYVSHTQADMKASVKNAYVAANEITQRLKAKSDYEEAFFEPRMRTILGHLTDNKKILKDGATQQEVSAMLYSFWALGFSEPSADRRDEFFPKFEGVDWTKKEQSDDAVGKRVHQMIAFIAYAKGQEVGRDYLEDDDKLKASVTLDDAAKEKLTSKSIAELAARDFPDTVKAQYVTWFDQSHKAMSPQVQTKMDADSRNADWLDLMETLRVVGDDEEHKFFVNYKFDNIVKNIEDHIDDVLKVVTGGDDPRVIDAILTEAGASVVQLNEEIRRPDADPMKPSDRQKELEAAQEKLVAELAKHPIGVLKPKYAELKAKMDAVNRERMAKMLNPATMAEGRAMGEEARKLAGIVGMLSKANPAVKPDPAA